MRDPSRFLRDIPSELLRLASPRASSTRYAEQTSWSPVRPSPPARAYRLRSADDMDHEPGWADEPSRQLEPSADAPAPAFHKGDSVSHPAFGQGVVLDSQIVGGDEQVSVLFKGHPTPKKLSLSFAPLQRA